jgi:hypothetical protein
MKWVSNERGRSERRWRKMAVAIFIIKKGILSGQLLYILLFIFAALISQEDQDVLLLDMPSYI